MGDAIELLLNQLEMEIFHKGYVPGPKAGWIYGWAIDESGSECLLNDETNETVDVR